MQYRQGDIFLETVETKKEAAKFKKMLDDKKLNLAENQLLVVGEGRDHAHYLIGDAEVAMFSESILQGSELQLGVAFVKNTSNIKHLNSGTDTWTKEHQDIEVPVGTYRIIKQTEHDYSEHVPRPVID